MLTLLACTHSVDNLFHTLMVLWENFLTSNLLCFFTSVKLCPLVILLSLISKINISTSEGQRRWDGVERKYESQDWGDLDMCRGMMMHIGRRMLRMELPGMEKPGSSKRRFVDAVREDMTIVEVTDEDVDCRT